MRWHLERAGFTALAVWLRDLERGAPGVHEGVDVFAPDVLVYEVQAPCAQSLQFLEALRSIPTFEEVPCVVTRAPSVGITELIAPAIAGVLTTPCHPRIATTIVRSALRFRSDTAA